VATERWIESAAATPKPPLVANDLAHGLLAMPPGDPLVEALNRDLARLQVRRTANRHGCDGLCERPEHAADVAAMTRGAADPRTGDVMDDMSLFDVPKSQQKQARQRPQLAHHAPVYTKYRPKNPTRKCDDCVLYLAQNNGHGPRARFARWRRRKGDGEQFLCSPHVQLRRDADRLPRLKQEDL
jgi:hypothetical protein